MCKFDVVIIGSGAAGYSAAERLLSLGMKNIAIVTENRMSGTSRNAGSDKQTYYKLSCVDIDSPQKMSEALSFGGGMHKDTAYIQSANSLRCFLHLVDLGVTFPTDSLGRFIGYKTDHDDTKRGTSAGPLTSKYMTECLEKKVINSGELTFLDDFFVTDIAIKDGACIGLTGIQKDKDSDSFKFIGIESKYIIAATGGCARVYQNTVYPKSQSGALGILANAGCTLNNICEWQYGIASINVRWNLSGSYQQVIPNYYAVDENGNKINFLKDYFENEEDVYNNIFLKGYQWPFDSKKINGSSKIDFAVSEMTKKGYRVYIDYRNNPNGFSFDKLNETAKKYLISCNCNGKTPVERLIQINEQSYNFFKNNGIDLAKQPLEIAVCAQHINGGVNVDTNNQTNIKNLFVIGEAAGEFGIYRPGGSALNATQVGALRAAEYIVFNKNNEAVYSKSDIQSQIDKQKAYIEKCLESENEMIDFSADMSNFAAQNRDLEKIKTLYYNLKKQCSKQNFKIANNDFYEVKKLYTYLDTINIQRLMCKTFIDALPKTGSRGGAVCFESGKSIDENTEYRNYAIQTSSNGDVEFVKLRDYPNVDFNFETVWQEYNRKRGVVFEQ